MYYDDSAILKRIGEGVKLERIRAGMSQRELALYADVHKNYIGIIERGEQAATIIIISKICSALGIGMGDFFQQLNL